MLVYEPLMPIHYLHSGKNKYGDSLRGLCYENAYRSFPFFWRVEPHVLVVWCDPLYRISAVDLIYTAAAELHTPSSSSSITHSCCTTAQSWSWVILRPALLYRSLIILPSFSTGFRFSVPWPPVPSLCSLITAMCPVDRIKDTVYGPPVALSITAADLHHAEHTAHWFMSYFLSLSFTGTVDSFIHAAEHTAAQRIPDYSKLYSRYLF